MTPQDVKEKFAREGKTFTSWARENGFEPGVVMRVVNGTNKGRYGEAHRAAVALGLKKGAA